MPEDTPPPPPPPPTIRELMAQVVEGQARTQAMVEGVMQLTMVTAQATFASLDSDQRSRYCRSLKENGMNASAQADLIGFSTPSVYRYLGNK